MTIIYPHLDPYFQVIGYCVAVLVAYYFGMAITQTTDDKCPDSITNKASMVCVGSPLIPQHSSSTASSDKDVSAVSVSRPQHDEDWLKHLVEAVLAVSGDDQELRLTNAIVSLEAAFSEDIQAADWKPVTTRLLRKLCPILGLSGLSSKPKTDMINAVCSYFTVPQTQSA